MTQMEETKACVYKYEMIQTKMEYILYPCRSSKLLSKSSTETTGGLNILFVIDHNFGTQIRVYINIIFIRHRIIVVTSVRALSIFFSFFSFSSNSIFHFSWSLCHGRRDDDDDDTR